MMWFFGIVIMLALGGVAFAASGRGGSLAEAYDDRPDALVPEAGPLRAADLRRVRFSVTLRGYRMSEVDALLDRLAAEREESEPTDGGPVPAKRGQAREKPERPQAEQLDPKQNEPEQNNPEQQDQEERE